MGEALRVAVAQIFRHQVHDRCNQQHPDSEDPGPKEQAIVRHRRQMPEQPGAECGVAQAVRAGGKGQEREDRGDADDLEAGLNKRKGEDKQEFFAAIRSRQRVDPLRNGECPA
jgi:hypothetical protein